MKQSVTGLFFIWERKYLQDEICYGYVILKADQKEVIESEFPDVKVSWKCFNSFTEHHYFQEAFMNLNSITTADFYIVSDTFQILEYNGNVAEKYPSIQKGDLCYKTFMHQDQPCRHCPLAYASIQSSPVFFDSRRHCWMEAVFVSLDEHRTAVTCRQIHGHAATLFHRLQKESCDDPSEQNLYRNTMIGVIGAYCTEHLPLYYVNDAMISMLGYKSRDELSYAIHGDMINLIHPDDRKRIPSDMTDFPVGRQYEASCRMQKKDGSWLWMISRGQLMETMDGRSAIISACIDVTQEKKIMEEKNREAIASASRESIFQDVIQALYSYCVTVNLNTGRYSLITGTGMESMIARCSTTDDYRESCYLLLNDVKEEYVAQLKEKLSLEALVRQKDCPGHIGRMEYEAVMDGKHGWFEVNVYIGVDHDGNPTASVFGRDVSEVHRQAITQAKLLASEASGKAKTAFLFNMSHDIRTPMNAIIGYTGLLKKHLDDRKLAENYLEKIETANDFLLSLINNVLEMSRIESGKVTLDESACNIQAFTAVMHAMLDEQVQRKHLHVTEDISIEHADIMADETKLREIHLNILSNAIKYTQDGGAIHISVKEYPCQKDDFFLYETKVRDTGIGISREYLPHIFEEFTREKTVTQSQIIGTGLGMPIVRKLVELMGGTITVESQIGKGTEVTIRIPHRLCKGEQKQDHFDYLEVFDHEMFEGKRILLVEDNDLNAEIAMTILMEEGFVVDRCENGEVCVQRIRGMPSGTYDLILMDIQMPVMNGYQATRAIRRLKDHKKADIPIIAMTANAFEEDRKMAFASGMNEHIPKPIQPSVFRHVLTTVLSRIPADPQAYRNWLSFFKESEPFQKFQNAHHRGNAAAGYLVYEADGNETLLYADENTVSMFGCSSYMDFYRYVDGSFKNIVHPDDLERVENEIIQQIYDSEDSIDHVSYRIIRKDGAIRCVDDIGRKVHSDNGIPVFYVSIIDTSE